jgi:hypothetical protein
MADGKAPVAEQKNAQQVVQRGIRWATSNTGKTYSKQRNEDQNDTMGRYQKRVVLIDPNGKEYVIQKDGKPTNVLSTYQRMLIKAMVAASFTVRTDKGSMFLNSIALNLKDAESTGFIEKLANEGWKIDAAYGAGPSLIHTDFSTFFGALANWAKLLEDTRKQYPPTEGDPKDPVKDEEVIEEVQLVL